MKHALAIDCRVLTDSCWTLGLAAHHFELNALVHELFIHAQQLMLIPRQVRLEIICENVKFVRTRQSILKWNDVNLVELRCAIPVDENHCVLVDDSDFAVSRLCCDNLELPVENIHLVADGHDVSHLATAIAVGNASEIWRDVFGEQGSRVLTLATGLEIPKAYELHLLEMNRVVTVKKEICICNHDALVWLGLNHDELEAR
mmetsp:Transcript_81832/g.127770  ORF Transcript_81832/g.127770 Transcript_81832/m.127770 type:complete len:202 (+) Transcript_81832:348-953(+)